MIFSMLLDCWLFILRVSQSSSSFPRPLTPDEEKDAIARMEAGDGEARALLIRHNLRLVAHIVKKFYASRDDQDDLISVGTVGLIKAISSYHSDKNIKLATYAAKCIENEILMYFRAQKKQACEISLSDPIDTDKDGNTLSLLDVISCEDTMLDDLAERCRSKTLAEYVGRVLSERERDLVILRYGLFGTRARTQQETAKIFGISRSYVSRLEKKALLKLRRAMEADDCVL